MKQPEGMHLKIKTINLMINPPLIQHTNELILACMKTGIATVYKQHWNDGRIRSPENGRRLFPGDSDASCPPAEQPEIAIREVSCHTGLHVPIMDYDQ